MYTPPERALLHGAGHPQWQGRTAEPAAAASDEFRHLCFAFFEVLPLAPTAKVVLDTRHT